MINSLESLFIRPSRHSYSTKDLGPQKLKIREKFAFRSDFNLKNKNNQKIYVSCFLFDDLKNTQEIVIYLHCNSGSRVQGALHAKQLLEVGLPLLVFDFSGSGISQGEFVTLGLNQSEDLSIVINYIRTINNNIKIALWGRSMGAVASLIYLSNNINDSIQAAIYDSPFSNLRELALDLGHQQTNIPKFMIQGFISIFNNHLKDKIKLDLMENLNINSEIGKIVTPGLFLGSKVDKLIPFKHIQSLYSKYGGYKQIYYLDQDHHERRNEATIDYIIKFIKKHLKQTLKYQKMSIANLIGIAKNKTTLKQNNKKNQISDINIKNCYQNIKKLDIVTKTDRKKHKEIKKHKEYFDKANESQKKKFICITEIRPSFQEKISKYQSSKLNRNQTQYFKQKQLFYRAPIQLCKKFQDRKPLKDIII